MQPDSSTRLLQYLSVVAVLLFVAASAIPHINRAPQIDEIDTFVNFTDSWVNALFFYARPNNHLAHSFLIWLCRITMGSSLLVLRFPAFVGTLVTLALIYRFGKRLAGYNLGFLALLLLATCTIIVDYAVNGRGYSLVNALTILLIWQLLYINPPFNRVDNYKLLGTAFLLMLIMPATLPILFGATLWLGMQTLIAWRSKNGAMGQYIKLTFSLLFGIILAIPFYSFAFLNLALYRTYVENFGYFVAQSMLTEWWRQVFGLSPVTGMLFIICIVGGIVVGAITKRWRWLGLVGIFILAAVIAGVVQFIITSKVFYPRNYLYFVPILALLGGFLALRLPRYAMPIAALALIASALLPIQNYLGKDSSVDTVREMVYDNLTEEDLLVVGCCFELQMLYYTKQDPTRLFDIMDYNDSKQSVVLLGTNHADVENLIVRYRLQELNLIGDITTCEPIPTNNWESDQFVRCPIVES